MLLSDIFCYPDLMLMNYNVNITIYVQLCFREKNH